MRRQKLITSMIALGAICVSVAGCISHEGGGWIESLVPGEKATFGFYLICDTSNDSVSGELQYNDHGVGVKAHCFPDSVDFGICSDDETDEGEFFGTYQAQPAKLGGGTFRVNVFDGGEPGNGIDSFAIEFFGGPYDGYFNGGFIEGGNVQRID